MASSPARARAPRGDASARLQRDTDVVASFLEDAAHFPGGHAPGIVAAATEADVAEALRRFDRVLPIGAQSSLTGGATPMGDHLLTTSRLNRIIHIGHDRVRVEAGVTVADLDAVLNRAGKYYPPAPTFTGAFVGGTVATNAAGAATFKHGTTREWVESLTVVLPSGDVLDIDRGTVFSDDSGTFTIETSTRRLCIRVPRYAMPHVPKCSAGYFAAPRMDLIDLFIGSEGTLGVVTAITLRIVPVRPAFALAFVPLRDRGVALAFVRELRGHGEIGVSAIEHMDARCLQLLREDGIDRQLGVAIPQAAVIALLVTLELPAGTTAESAYDDIATPVGSGARGPLSRLCELIDGAGALDDTQIAVPGDRLRAAQLIALREGVPAAVNARVGRAKREVDARIAKTAADMIVPFEHFEALLDLYDVEFRRRGLDAAVWGHISDGNVHPNVIPRSIADVESGKEAILAFGREAIRLGGSPLAEHGVGRNPVKQQLLRELYGEEGIEQMRAVKRAIDPEWKLARGVLFPAP
jgi:D-lactate dehydrogenase (cytochrome)